MDKDEHRFQLRVFRVVDWLAFLVATVLVLAAASVSVSEGFFEPFNVSYDHRALIIGGKRRMLISAGVHYPRATPEMWPGIIAKSKEGGADVIETYVFWNGHEPIRGQYYFEGRYNIVKFVKLVGSNGLYLHLRIGPYVCAEWNFGGFPTWLRDIPGIEFRTNNEPFKVEMQRFVTMIVELMKKEMLFSWQGGPIILLQIENEYGNVEGSYGGGKEYVKWAAEMALGLEASVPWVMCKQPDAPETVIDTCNGFYCDGFKPNAYKKPILWTEDWNGWYASWGEGLPHRPVEDNAFAVARFFQRGGSYSNYYMFFGGTNFDRTAGGPLQITSYDYDAPIDEYGLISEPKWGHLKDLHAAIKLCEPALIFVDHEPQYVKLGPMQEAHVYSSVHVNTSESLPKDVSICSAFLANIDEHKSAGVKLFDRSYTLAPWSVIILPDCKSVAFNTAQVGSQISVKTIGLFSAGYSNSTVPEYHLLATGDFSLSSTWMTLSEPIGIWNENSFTSEQILEHLNVTKDASDYLWYITRVNVSEEEISHWMEMGILPSLTIHSIRDVAQIFLNGLLIGGAHGNWVKLEQTLKLVQGCNELALISETIGLKNYGAFIEKDGAGLKGPIKLVGFKDGDMDLSTYPWTYQVGLKGEFARIFDPVEQEKVSWIALEPDKIQATFIWYKAYFDAPDGKDPISIYLGGMGKGQAWVNGHGIGRYWSLVAPKDGCSETCNYRGAYNEKKCRTNCGKPTQTWYHIPREWLQASNNLFVIFEETGGNPLTIKLKKIATKTICAEVSEMHCPPLSAWQKSELYTRDILPVTASPELLLHCDDGHRISAITFASFGTPHGVCQNFSKGRCHSESSFFVVSEACLGKNRCSIRVAVTDFSPDPCRGVGKTLAVQAECSSPSDYEMFPWS